MRQPFAAAIVHRRRRLLLGDTVEVSATFSTFVSANYTPTADGTTATTLTFTARDAANETIEGVSVTYA